MHPRASLLSRFASLSIEAPVRNVANPEICTANRRAFSSQPPLQKTTTAVQRRKYRDPYAVAQTKARKAANLTRQAVLKKEREAALGDPVRGVTTSFVRSFDSGKEQSDSSTPLRHLVKTEELNSQLQRSESMTRPIVAYEMQIQREIGNEIRPEQRKAFSEQVLKQHFAQHAGAEEAMRRILNLNGGSAKDRLRTNIQRCITKFGRHETDATLPAKPRAASTIQGAEALAQQELGPEQQDVIRAGPDTGSSEVQIAVLTAKIRSLAEFVAVRGRKDHVNKRNLRLLVHKRQKLLQYLRRKERGGPRWQHCIETLGLTQGTWLGEITV